MHINNGNIVRMGEYCLSHKTDDKKDYQFVDFNRILKYHA